ncbi:MAG: hypothetical protein AB7E55_01280 [Pigmentiphaga sp.]
MSENNSWFETERLLHGYWRRRLQLERLQSRLSALRDEVAELELELRHARRIPGLVSRYGLVPAAGAEGYITGYEKVLAEYEEHVQTILGKIVAKRRQIIKLQARIAELQEENAAVETVVSRLTVQEQTLIEQRYVYRRSNYQIAEIIHQSEPTVRRMHRRIVLKVADWLGKRKDS